jgi:hypothetical protein
VYVPAGVGVAEIVALAPGHTVAEVTVTLGTGLTMIVVVVDALHPPALV